MIYFESQGNKYGLSFSHITLDNKRKTRRTICKIYVIDPETGKTAKDKTVTINGKEETISPEVSVGIAQCSSTDIFCKETGRELALNRAIDNAYNNRRKSYYKPILTQADKRNVKATYHSRSLVESCCKC